MEQIGCDILVTLFSGRSPTVQEFSKFLLTFEGNDMTNSSRKTLGTLYKTI